MDSLKHIVLFLISPLNIVIIFFIIGMLLSSRNSKIGRSFKSCSIILFLLFSQPYVGDLLLYPLEHSHQNAHNQIQKPSPDYILVFACYYSTIGKVPDISRWTECSLQRNIEAFKLHALSGVPIIITGGNFLYDPAVNYSEEAKAFFLSLGVKENNIIVTRRGTNTSEELISAKSYLQNSHIWVVSSATHIYRLQNQFDDLKINGTFFPVNHHSRGELVPYLTFPSAAALIKNEHALYEYAALVKQKLLILLENRSTLKVYVI